MFRECKTDPLAHQLSILLRKHLRCTGSMLTDMCNTYCRLKIS